MQTNQFKSDRDKDLIDFKNPNLWMHSVERQEIKDTGNILISFAIGIATLALMFGLLCAAAEYGKAYPSKTAIVNK